LASAQAAIEYAAGAAAAASTAGAAKSAGKSVAGALEKLNRTLDQGSSAEPETAATAPRSKAAARRTTPAAKAQRAATAAAPAAPAAAAAPAFEDPWGIQEGMLYADVVRRFGPPSLALTTGPGEQTLSYMKNGASFDVKVSNGKVAAVPKSGGA